MGVKYCKYCNTRMIGGLYPYENPEWDDFADVEKIPGYKCFNKNCPKEGYVEFDEEVQKSVEQDIQLKKLLYQTKKEDESPIKPILISKVKNARLSQDIQPKLIADVLGVTDQRYGAIERNSNTPNVFIALQLEKIMGVDIHEIYELVYISSSLYEKLRILNTDFEVVPGIPERLESINDIERNIIELKERLKNRREDISSIVKSNLAEEKKVTKKTLTTTQQRRIISKEIDKDEENNRLLAEIDKKLAEKVYIRKQIDFLMGKDTKESPKKLGLNISKNDIQKQNFLLRLGTCIDYENWLLVKDKYAEELNKDLF